MGLYSPRANYLLAMLAPLAIASEPLSAANIGLSKAEAHELVLAAESDFGYPADRIWDDAETFGMSECSQEFYCFDVRVDAGEWSPVIANFAVNRFDVTVWELWQCRPYTNSAVRKKQGQLRTLYHLRTRIHRPTEFMSDCLDSSD